MSKLAIIDWGIGGVSLYKRVKAARPDSAIIYFSDTGVTPYGKMTRPDLVSRLDALTKFLIQRGASHLVIGCNAASTVIPYLVNSDIVIEGMVATAVRESIRHRPDRLALIGGRRTVVSGVYRRAFKQQGVDIVQRIAQPLSGLIESGDVSSHNLRLHAKKILLPLRNSSHILLACTHYPAITPILRQFVSPATVFIDPAAALVKTILGWSLDEGRDEFFTSGDRSAMRSSASLAFGVQIGEIEKAEINLLI